MNPKAMEPFGLALMDFFNGEENISVAIVRDDGLRYLMPVRNFFRSTEEFSLLEKKALELCKGRVVDLSAGVGPDCLELQKRGYDVHAVEISRHACEIMEKRGVENVYCSDFFDFRGADFDTILLFGRSIGNVETLNGLERFLNHAANIIKPNGQIIFDSLDVRKTNDPSHLAYHARNTKAGRYVGEVRTRMEYKGIQGPYFGLLHIDPVTLTQYCIKTGWLCDIIYQEPEGNYITRLIKG